MPKHDASRCDSCSSWPERVSQENAAGEETSAEIPTDMVVARRQGEVHLYSSMCPSILFEVEDMTYVR
jgi:hypothetical protein